MQAFQSVMEAAQPVDEAGGDSLPAIEDGPHIGGHFAGGHHISFKILPGDFGVGGDKVHNLLLNPVEVPEGLRRAAVVILPLVGGQLLLGPAACIQKIIPKNKTGKTVPMHTFSGVVEHAIAHIEEAAVHNMPPEQQRWYAIKLFERDEKASSRMQLPQSVLSHIEEDIQAAEKELDDDAESIITNERYVYIASLMKGCYKKKRVGKLSTSDQIDKVVTNRWLALPIFAVVMFLVYFVSVTTVGTWATDWANDGVFGDGWHLLGIGSSAYNEVADEFGEASQVVNGFLEYASENGVDTEAVEAALDTESEEFDPAAAKTALTAFAGQFSATDTATYVVVDEETMADEEVTATGADLAAALTVYDQYGYAEPDPADYGVWVPGVPVLVERGLDAIGCADWLRGLILDGIVAGVGAVLGFA